MSNVSSKNRAQTLDKLWYIRTGNSSSLSPKDYINSIEIINFIQPKVLFIRENGARDFSRLGSVENFTRAPRSAKRISVVQLRTYLLPRELGEMNWNGIVLYGWGTQSQIDRHPARLRERPNRGIREIRHRRRHRGGA